MDIQVASNFERYLFYRLGREPAAVRAAMDRFEAAGELEAPRREGDPADGLFAPGTGGTEDVLRTIRAFHERHGYLLDPHTAVGVHAAGAHLSETEPMICLATAHPAKFPRAILRATGRDLARHPLLDALADAPVRCDTVAGRADAVRRYLEDHLPGGAEGAP